MTLILTAGNSDQIIMVADRRLSANGTLVDDESNKAIAVTTRDARLLVGFTGLAAVGTLDPDGYRGPPGAGTFRTAWWLLETLGKVAPPDHTADNIVERFAIEATAKFRDLRGIRAMDKGLYVVFAGYTYHERTGQREPFFKSVTNYTSGMKVEYIFKVEGPPDGLPPSRAFLTGTGAHQALESSDIDGLRTLIEQRVPARAIVGKAVEVIRAAADRTKPEDPLGSK